MIISWHTPDPLYTAAADRLRTSLDKFRLKHEIFCFPPRGSWTDNASYKANFIYAMIQKHPKLVWLDADAEVVAYPELLGQLEGNVAAVIHPGEELLDSTLYLQRSDFWMDKFLEAWILANKAFPRRSTAAQINFQEVLGKEPYQSHILFEKLPHSYAQIFDYPYEDGLEPVILQHQLSRQGRELYP